MCVPAMDTETETAIQNLQKSQELPAAVINPFTNRNPPANLLQPAQPRPPLVNRQLPELPAGMYPQQAQPLPPLVSQQLQELPADMNPQPAQPSPSVNLEKHQLAPVDMNQQQHEFDGKDLWPVQSVQIMINQFRLNNQEIQVKKKKKTEIYDNIQSELKEKLNIVRSITQIKNKWKYLMDQYKKESDRRKTSGESGNDPFEDRFEFFTDFDELYGKNPTINPAVTFSSRSGRKKNLPKKTKTKDAKVEVEVAMNPGPSKPPTESPDDRDVWDQVAAIYGYDNSDEENVDVQVKKEEAGVKKRKAKQEKKKTAVPPKRTAAGTFMAFLEKSGEKKEEKRQRRHEERTEIMQGFLNTFQQLNNNVEAMLKKSAPAGKSGQDSDSG